MYLLVKFGAKGIHLGKQLIGMEPAPEMTGQREMAQTLYCGWL